MRVVSENANGAEISDPGGVLEFAETSRRGTGSAIGEPEQRFPQGYPFRPDWRAQTKRAEFWHRTRSEAQRRACAGWRRSYRRSWACPVVWSSLEYHCLRIQARQVGLMMPSGTSAGRSSMRTRPTLTPRWHDVRIDFHIGRRTAAVGRQRQRPHILG